MCKLTQFNVSAQLALLTAKTQLSNAVSRQALAEASVMWSAHQAKYDYERSPSDLVAVNRNINLIVTQVTNRVTRINPLMWGELVKLNTALNIAILNNINFEPRPVPVVAANADENCAEVVNG